MSDIDLSLLPDYLVEAAEHLEEIETLLLRLTEEPSNTDLMNEIFRPVHSIKGAAQFIGLERTSRIAHRLEDLLDLMRKGAHPSSFEAVELLISARDLISNLADELENTQTEISQVDDIVERITEEIDSVSKSDATPADEDMVNITDSVDEEIHSAVDESDMEEHSLSGQEQVDAGNDDAYQEENDPELFGIFLENLRENTDLIASQAEGLENSIDQIALLERCTESIKALNTAANYMRYDELTAIYSNWLEDIVAVQDALSRNEDVPYDFMDAYLSEIRSLFPQLVSNENSGNVDAEDVAESKELLHENQHDRTYDDEPDEVESESAVDTSLLPDYLVEAAENLEEAESLILRLVEEPENTDLMNEIFRPVHSIKGAAQFIGLEKSSRLAHRLEDLLDQLRKGERQSTPAVIELLISARDLLSILLGELESSEHEISSVDEIVENLSDAIETGDIQAAAAVAEDISLEDERTADSPYDEEYDQELFGIFLENLREKIDLIRIQSSEFSHTSDRVALLDRCKESLDSLYSAANYMGYEELTEIYTNWLEDISAVQQALANDEDIPDDFMDAYLSEIYSLFPQIAHISPVNTGVEISDVEVAREEFDAGDEVLLEESSSPGAGETAIMDAEIEEVISAKDETDSVKESQTAKAAKDKTTANKKSEKAVVRKSVRVDAEKIDSLINQVGELVVDRAYFFQLFEDMRGLQQHFKDDIGLDQKELKKIRAFTYRMGEAIASLSRTSNELQEGVMKVRMLPISQLFNRYPRLVHDLTHNNDKTVNLKVEGEDTELDKMVVEKLSDPLIHIIRNAIDHGIESVQDRVGAGKPEAGTLFLKSYHESNQVVVEIFDDGRGIDPEKVKEKAIEKGIISSNEAERMLPQEIVRLITTAGFSTAKEITDTSGRGVGMDVVRKNIEKLNGTLEIDSRPGLGTSIRLKIPLTLAIIPAHLVRVGGNMYTIPLANIEETLRINKDETTIIEGAEVVYLRGKTLPVIHLSTLFSTSSYTDDRENLFVVVVNTGTQKIGLVVDELLGQEEVVIKPLVDYLRDETGFSGATIIGDGTISLILDIYEIANMTASMQIKRQNDLFLARQSGNAAVHLGHAAH